MDLSLKNKRAVVCGSTQGIGKATAIELAKLGADITLVARNETTLKLVLASLDVSAEQQHNILVADFSNHEAVKEKITTYASNIDKVHILINNTGGPPAGTVLDATAEEFLAAFSAHLLCNQHLVQALVPLMKNEKYGRIINVISTSVKVPIPGLGVSNTTRGAVANWAKTLANELAAEGITVNNVLPGATATGRLDSIINKGAEKAGITRAEKRNQMLKSVPAQRFAAPEEVAYAIAFLASPAAGYVNGVNLPVDGGRTPSL